MDRLMKTTEKASAQITVKEGRHRLLNKLGRVWRPGASNKLGRVASGKLSSVYLIRAD